VPAALGVVLVSRTGRWWVAALIMVAAFAGAAWVSGAVILAPLLASSGDRWAVASGVGVAVAAFAALWGQWWATRAEETAAGDRSVAIGRDNTGIIATGDGAVSTQDGTQD
jgi:hypothetical protein